MIEYIFLVLFLIDAIIHIFGIVKENQKIIYCTKPLLMILLAAYYTLGTIALNTFDWLMLVAILCGCSGDTFLMFKDNDKYFLLGMLSFMLGHIFYIISFTLYIGVDMILFPVLGLLLFLPTLIILYFTFPRFKDKMGDMKIPVMVYMGVIMTMNLFTIFRLSKIGLFCPCFFLTYLGSVLFILSDSLIAVNIFDDKKVKNVRIYIMVTYILGQFLIAQGVLMTGLL